jgi:hypothetical protein
MAHASKAITISPAEASSSPSSKALDCILSSSETNPMAAVPASSSSNNATVTSSSISSSLSSFTLKTPELPTLPKELQYDPNRLKQVNDEYRLELIKNAELKATLKNGWQLLKHQKSGILKGILMRRLVLAYDMGLGTNYYR